MQDETISAALFADETALDIFPLLISRPDNLSVVFSYQEMRVAADGTAIVLSRVIAGFELTVTADQHMAEERHACSDRGRDVLD